MKKLIYLPLLLLLSQSANAQVPYTPFDFETSSWNEFYYALWFINEYTDVYADGDTLIDNVTYYKLREVGIQYMFDDPMQWEPSDSMDLDFYAGAVRENNQKQIEYIYPFQTEPQIIYDFNMQLGDTLNLLGGIDIQYDAIVTSIDTVEVCGTLRNRYWMTFIYPAIDYPYIIEGVGSSAGIVPNYELFESGGDLLCYSKLNCECGEITTSTLPLPTVKNYSKVFPNPVSNQLNIETTVDNKDVVVTVVNSLGQTFFQFRLTTPQLSIDCNEWPKGYYTIVLSGTHWQEQHRVLVVNEK